MWKNWSCGLWKWGVDDTSSQSRATGSKIVCWNRNASQIKHNSAVPRHCWVDPLQIGQSVSEGQEQRFQPSQMVYRTILLKLISDHYRCILVLSLIAWLFRLSLETATVTHRHISYSKCLISKRIFNRIQRLKLTEYEIPIRLFSISFNTGCKRLVIVNSCWANNLIYSVEGLLLGFLIMCCKLHFY